MAPRRHFRWNKGARRVRPARRLQVECLETRNLLSVAINEFPIPTPGSDPAGITTGPDGNLWFTEADAATRSARSTRRPMPSPSSPSPRPTANPAGITAGPDGNLWFTEATSATRSARSTRRRTRSPSSPSPRPTAYPYGHHGRARRQPLVHRGTAGNKIGQINPTTQRSPSSPSPRPTATPGHHGRARRQPLVHRVRRQQDRPDQPDDPCDHRVPHPHAQQRPRGHHGRARRQPLVHRVRRQQDRPDQPDDPAHHRVPHPHARQRPRRASRPGPTATSGSPSPSATRSARSTRRPMPSPSSPSPRPTAAPRASRPGPTATSGSPSTSGGKIGQIVVAAGPTVLAVQRFGFHSRPTSLVLTFNEPLNSITAENTASYTIVGPHGRGVAVNAAVYDPATQTVTLTPSRRLNLHRTYRLIVNGTGPNAVLDTLGLPLNATGFGRPGSDFVTTVTIANWVRPLHRLSVRHRRLSRRPVVHPDLGKIVTSHSSRSPSRSL